MPLPVKILLVEDDAIAQLVLMLQFQQLGCIVDLAATSEQAIDLFLKGDYDFILMDIRLPGTNGFEVTRHLRATEKGRVTPIIGITAYALFCVEDEGRAAGMNAVIEKPCSREAAIRLISFYSKYEK